MNKDEQELVENYRKLTPANKTIALSNLRVALATQENTLKSVDRPAKKRA
jgi:hypothetical protein